MTNEELDAKIDELETKLSEVEETAEKAKRRGNYIGEALTIFATAVAKGDPGEIAKALKNVQELGY